jgi:hypothetical protein
MFHTVTSEARWKASGGNSLQTVADGVGGSGGRQNRFAALQSAYGNQALLRLLDSSSKSQTAKGPRNVVLQRKCACGGRGEGECAECKKKEESGLQRSPAAGARASSGVPPIVHEVLRSPGQPLDRGTRAFMEPRFGQDFSQVRVHTDSKAAQSARAVGALAYTVGSDLVFGTEQYAPEAAGGIRLLAHELAHVVQQGSTPPHVIPRSISRKDEPSERQAERAVEAISLGRKPTAIAGADTRLQRYSHEDCTEDDLKSDVWPADYIARQMTKKAIRVLSTDPIPSSVTPVISKYFMTSTPRLAAILKVYDKIDAEYRANDYTYECEDDCSGTELGYVYGFWSDIHLCMNHLRAWTNECIARTMVHEMSHYYAGTDDNAYCKSDCGFASCPSSLSADDALNNADSYACLAYELYPMGV